MPQRKRSNDALLSRIQADANVDTRKLMAASPLGERTKDHLAELSAKSKITLEEFKAILAAEKSLPEVLKAKKRATS